MEATMLAKLLQENRDYESEYGNQLSNHHSMALFSLAYLGASTKQMMDFSKGYTKILNPRIPAQVKITSRNWRKYLGAHKYQEDYYQFFKAELNQLGVEKTLHKYLPHFASAISSDAFHPLIRLGYAFEFQHEDEMAEALAQWCISFEVLPAVAAEEERSWEELLEHLRILNTDRVGKSIQDRMRFISQSESNVRHITGTKFSKERFQQFCDLVGELYYQTGNFTLLHALTSSYALSKLEGYFGDDIYQFYLEAICYSYVESGAPAFTVGQAVPQVDFDWEDVLERVRGHKNAHTVKVVYCLYRLYEQTQKRVYLAAAGKELKLVPLIALQ